MFSPRFLRPIATSLLFALLVAPAIHAAAESMSERELKRIVKRERTVLDAANANAEQIDEKNVRLQLQEIVGDYEALLKRDPEFVPTYVAYGLLLGKVGETKRAAEIFLRANKLDDKLAVVKNQLGNFCAEDGKYQEALAYYVSASELEPTEPLYHYQIGMLLYEYRDHFVRSARFTMADLQKQSQRAFAKAAEMAPDNVGYAYRHAESFYDQVPSDWEAALVAWRALKPRMKAGLEAQTIELHEANVLIKLGRREEAKALLDGVTEAALQSNKEKLVAELKDSPDKPR